jgi:predicted nucleotidyltransferase
VAKNRDDALLWLRQAGDDYRFGRAALTGRFYAQGCFIAPDRRVLGRPGAGRASERRTHTPMGPKAARQGKVARWITQRLPTLLRRHGVHEAYLFGSWARGEADVLSDIDLVVVAPSRRPFVDRFHDYPDLLDAPAGLDLLVYTPTEFARERRQNRFVRHVLHEARRVV